MCSLYAEFTVHSAIKADAVEPRARMAMHSDTMHPTLRANPCHEVTDRFCRLPLPTFVYRLEATHLGDLMRFWVRSSTKVLSSLGFSRIDKSTPDNVRRHCSSSRATASPNNSLLRLSELLNRKENSPQGSCRCLRVHLRYRANSAAWYGNINPFPFRWITFLDVSLTELPNLLGSTHPCPIAVRMEPFSTPVLKALA